MRDMAEKPEARNLVPGQLMLFDELVESSASLFQWPHDVHDRRVRNVAAGQVVVRQGSKSDGIFEIISGMLKLSQVTEEGRQIILGFPSAGDVIGLTGGQEYRYAAETVTVARLRPVPWTTFYEQTLQHRSARTKLLGWIDAQEQMVQDHIAVLSLQSPKSKLATFLLKQMAQQTKGTGYDDMVIGLPMTQRDIATYLAIAPETCSRAMKKLREDAIIESGGRTGEGQWLKILNRQRLNEAANGRCP